jgi:hypothetical protein
MFIINTGNVLEKFNMLRKKKIKKINLFKKYIKRRINKSSNRCIISYHYTENKDSIILINININFKKFRMNSKKKFFKKFKLN